MSEKRRYRKEGTSKRWLDLLRGRRRKSRRAKFVELVVILLVAFVLVFGFIRPFVLKSFWIPSESMTPTLEVGDRVFVNKFIYRFTEPERGDMVVFENVENEYEDLIKRVVAVPGDRVRINQDVLRVNGEVQEEPYVENWLPFGGVYGPEIVPEGQVFVMGDNRDNSRDSRFFGPIPIENIEGEAFFRFWPPSRIGPL